MSSTRHSDDPSAPLSQERYMSSLEYAELRGISGNAVTAKAALMAHPQKRSLIFFLQAMSLQPGGLRKFCREFLEMFPNRLGTPTMHKAGMKPGKNYSPEIAEQIQTEIRAVGLSAEELAELLQSMPYPWKGDGPDAAPREVDYWIEFCRERSNRLDRFIIELCVNPSLRFSVPKESEQSRRREMTGIEDAFAGQNLDSFKEAQMPWFADIIGALFEFKRRYEEAARHDFVMTEVGRQVCATLDAGLATGKMVVIEGNSGIGKSTALEHWANLHLGEARLVSLSGISQKTGIFRAIAKSLGVACSLAHTATRVQIRVEDTLQRSGLMLLVDEAHFLFSGAQRVYSEPEMVNWVNTALCNHKVPAALVVTPQFRIRLARVEKQTTWNADQLRRRVKRFTQLPAKPLTKDLEAVTRKLLPGATKEQLDYIVGYSLASKLHLPAIVDAIDEARLVAQRDGRERITFEDVQRAIGDYCATSAQAWVTPIPEPGDGRRRRARPLPAAADIDAQTGDAKAGADRAAGLVRKQNLTGLKPALMAIGNRFKSPLQREEAGEPMAA